jgi:drug/metabolite transporter (DMT)-like permease
MYLCMKKMDTIKKDFRNLNMRLLVEIAVSVTVGVFVANIIFYQLLAQHDSYLVTALTYTSPMFTVVLAWMFLNEQISWVNVLGIVVLIVGILLVCYKGGKEGFRRL